MHCFSCKTAVGIITICANRHALTGVYFGGHSAIDDRRSETEIIREARRQLDEYFSGSRRQFELEFEYSGSDFQLGVWKELTKIPFGETMTYKDIADAVGSPSSCRAVGAACGRNPMAIFIPCHRVVGSDGSLTGYAGGLEIKKKLLELERKYAPSV